MNLGIPKNKYAFSSTLHWGCGKSKHMDVIWKTCLLSDHVELSEHSRLCA